MVKKLTRAGAIVLALMLLATGGLYLFANAEALYDWLAPMVRAAQAAEAQPPSSGPVINPLSTRHAPLPQSAASGEATQPPEALPKFVLSHMLGLVPEESNQAVFVLCQGQEANLWLVQRDSAGQWVNAMGPVYARLGGDGMGRRDDQNSAFPQGWHWPGALYAAQPQTLSWPTQMLSADSVWSVDPKSANYNTLCSIHAEYDNGMALSALGDLLLDLGHNPDCTPGLGAGAFIYGAPAGESAVEGCMALLPEDMARLAQWLDAGQNPCIGVFSAYAAGWQIDRGLPDGFVMLAQVASGIREEPRYALDDNFMGRPLDGYQGLHIVLRRETAEALARVQQQLEGQGLGLLVYDGYRPARAVRDIFSWLSSGEPGRQSDYYPELEKSDLPGVYLAEHSPHRRGIAVDLTLCDLQTGQPLDMGTGFDFFSSRSWARSRDITEDQAQNRETLRKAMAAQGFSPYSKEWWHFNFDSSGIPLAAFDFVIPQ